MTPTHLPMHLSSGCRRHRHRGDDHLPRLRIIDFFRGRKYNNSMENIGMRVDDDDGDNLLNPEEFANILRETVRPVQ